MQYLGYMATFLTFYNIFCGMLYRMASNDEASRHSGLEASIWFVAACICFK